MMCSRAAPGSGFARRKIRGEGQPATELTIPYGRRELRGSELTGQLREWVDDGVVEPSCAGAVEMVMEHPEWLPLRGQRIVLIGAGAEMSPLEPLSSWGADVVAIDRPIEGISQRIETLARRGAGRTTIPLADGDRPGLDIVHSPAQARDWIAGLAAGEELVLGMYAYADSGMHVRVSVAADMIASDLLARRPQTALAFLGTPTDAYLVPEEVVEESRRAYAARRVRRVLQGPLRLASAGRLFAPAYTGGSTIADVLVSQQGPNYAIAKRIQRWRGVLASTRGSIVSFNVAPPTLTRSVTKNRLLAAAYAGAGRFGIEVFPPPTARALMAALLVHDLNITLERGHPEGLFSDGAAHGGLWRAPYDPRSVLGIAALSGLHATLRR